AERLEHRCGKGFGTGLELVPLSLAPRAQRRATDTSVLGVRPHIDETFCLEGAQQAARVAGIQTEARSEAADVVAVATDLPEEAGLAERPLAPEEVLAQRARALGGDAIEPPDLCELGSVHSSDLSQRYHKCTQICKQDDCPSNELKPYAPR